jgi:Pentapeptide repeats (8 copies)
MGDEEQNEQAEVGQSTLQSTVVAPSGYRSWTDYWRDLNRLQSAAMLSSTPPEGYSLWKDYWTEQGMSWRKMPEIDEERKVFLAQRRAIEPDVVQGIYPFKDVELNRADIEWLLATHEAEGQIGPVRWPPLEEENEYRVGSDLRGAMLATLDLSYLPLTRIIGGLDQEIFPDATPNQREAAAMNLQGANLSGCKLQEAELAAVRLQGALLWNAELTSAKLGDANLDEADLYG